jgi:DNA polymerase-3 subunit delta'
MGFDAFIGNPKALAAVREMVHRGRIPGALLFAGPEGVGKKTLALMLAKALVCAQGGGDFCGECAPCRKAQEMFEAAREDHARRREIKEAARRVEGLIYFDLQIIEPLTRFILTEQIRHLRAVAYTCPFEFSRRVFIVDQAQAIHWQAVDLLLKVLEEPPASTTLILVCPNAYELRSTIRSRCLRLTFQPVEEPMVAELLAKERRLTKPQQALAARVAAGSVARAKAFQPDDYERRRKPWLDFLEVVARSARPAAQSAAPAGEATLPEGLRAAGRPDAAVLDWPPLSDSARAIAENREDFEGALQIGYSLLRDLLQVLFAASDNEVVNVDLLPQLRTWALGLGLEGIEKLKSGLDQAYRLRVRNVNQQLGLETLGIELLTASRPVAR